MNDEQTTRRSKLNAALQARLSKRLETVARKSSIPRRPDLAADVPLSFAQERLWFLEKLIPGTPLYNIPYALRFKGTLDVNVMREALNGIIMRHESLRTRFQERDGQVLQHIEHEGSLTLDCIELGHLPTTERDVAVQTWMQQEATQPFDLTTNPLLRAKVLKLAQHDHLLLLTIHHIVSDGWSTGVLVREFATLYAQLVQGQTAALPPLPIQYPDFSVWQREYLQGEAYEKQLTYWKEQLAGDIPLLQLPTDFPRTSVQNQAGACHTFPIPPDLMESLKELAHHEGVTLYMVLLAGFYTLLHRYSQQDDLLVGSPIAGRNRYEVEGLIGFFVNTLVMRLQLSPNWTFRELIARVKEVTTGAFEHQDMPFEKLVAELHPQRLLSHSPFFQVMFVLQNAPLKQMELPQLTIENVDTHAQMVKFDLTLSVWEAADSSNGQLEYQTDLFTAATIERMMNHYLTLLQAIAEQPEQTLSTAPLLTDRERQQLLYKWNDAAERSAYPEALIHHLFEEQAEKTPDAVALVYETERVTYAELNARANRLAHLLRQHGVGPHVWVGISLPRTIELVVGLIAIFKAGGAYVAIDPTYPIDRIQYLIEDAEVGLVLTHSQQAERLTSHQVTAPLLCVDQQATTLAEQPTGNLTDTGVTTNDFVYMIYTSGSTGKPKGVPIEHRNVSTLVQWAKEYFTEADRNGLLFATSINFDLSVFELFGTIGNGGKVVLVENLLHLPHAPAANEVSMICAVPSTLAELIRMNSIPRSVRTLFLGGEAFRSTLAKQLQALDHVEKLYNAYGPTEDTVISTIGLVDPTDERDPLIGHPLPTKRLYVLDAHQQPVPIGVTGELYISGDGLARTYWRRPELSAKTFLPNPFSSAPDARMYKTGDLVRYQADGQLEYVGRVDDQIKIRGFRVELGEIEHCLTQLPLVAEAIVLVREDQPGDKRLVAYVVPHNVDPSHSDPHPQELRRLLKQSLRTKLPAHMVPSAFVLLDKFPQMLNGKIDRNQLPLPTFDRSELEHEHTPPRNETESILAQLVAEVLQVEQVGVHDNFFELGGHSLLGVQLISRIRSEMNIELPLHHLFESPTVAELALIVERESMQSAQSTAPAMVARSRQARTVRK